MSTMDVTSDFALSISAAPRAIHEPRTVDESLRTIAEVSEPRQRHHRQHQPLLHSLRRGEPQRASATNALHGRKVMGVAIGILMERYEMNEDRAFAFLVRASSHTNIKLRAVAQLVDGRNSPRVTR